MAYTVILDAGHGGEDFGATYNGRKEKDDTLQLALAVGKILEANCINVEYTRTTDVYNTPYEKAAIANNSGADFFVSIHRNAYITPNTTKGVETLVFNDEGIKAKMARNINANLAKVGFVNRGVVERPNLVVLKRTRMPALLVEAGFIDSDEDNARFDENFDEIANAIAQGIIETIGGCPEQRRLYRVQVGAYRDRRMADELLNELKEAGYPAFIVMED
ncbi:MAG: N-acetylmuramoyl-L-alanine amidase, partial [Lachnospiraceae bacterium]|nr:N-acetylmuramoyl-L-alanine amidase [Lachnospiraceae bacterium]